MPYGIRKEIGGDSPENVSWMERCVNHVMDSGKPKSNAVAICKAQLDKKKSKAEEEIFIDSDILASFEAYKNQYINKVKNTLGVDLATANAMFDVHLARNNFIWNQ